jgi:hypothetical protein
MSRAPAACVLIPLVSVLADSDGGIHRGYETSLPSGVQARVMILVSC